MLTKLMNCVNPLFKIIITFLKINVRFQPELCDGCRDLMLNYELCCNCFCETKWLEFVLVHE